MVFRRPILFPMISVLGFGLLSGAALAKDAPNAPAPTAEVLPPDSQVIEDIVARVNDRIITDSDYKRAEQQLEQEGLREGLSPDEVDARKKTLLRDLIDQQLLLSKGKQLGISGETGMVKRLDEIRKANHLKTMEELEKAAQAQHVSFEDFKASIRNSVITQDVVRQEVSPHITISPQEVKAYYDEHKDDFSQPESVELSEILIPTSDNPSAADLAKASAKANDVEAKLKGGSDFAKLAEAVSGGPTAARGGALGQFRHGMMAPQLEEKTFSLKAGQFTEPIRTKQGYVILEVTAHTPAGVEPFERVRSQVEEAVFMQKMQPALRKYLTQLREQAYVDIKPGFVDSGASPNEMQMTYSAYTPPGHKEKKVFHRTRFRGRQRGAARAAATQANATNVVAVVNDQAPAGSQKGQEQAKPKQVVRQESKSEQRLGKKEKIRFGQAPRESLPAATTDVESATVAQNTPASAPTPANPDVHYVNPNGAENESAQPQVEEKKTRLGSTSRFHFHHKKKEKPVEKPLVPPPTPIELQTQKVQDQPLGLGDHEAAKAGKKKPEEGKTRLNRVPQKQEPTQQPYMGGQQPASSPTSSQPKSAADGQQQ